MMVTRFEACGCAGAESHLQDASRHHLHYWGSCRPSWLVEIANEGLYDEETQLLGGLRI